jgi:uncharacterized protein
VREQEVASGHAVRAVYMYTAMADLANELDDEILKKTCQTLWNNVTQKQMYLTAGIGSAEFGEAFSFDYDLPSDLSYTETCASIGLVFWAQKMLALEANGVYGDVIERAIYNGTISGIQLDGTKFFYVNPLEVWPKQANHRHDYKHVKAERQPWFGCACCPPNIARLITSIGSYVYSVRDHIGFVHLYIASATAFTLGDTRVEVAQTSNFPWSGDIQFTVNPERSVEGTLAFRIPGWARSFSLKVNGEEAHTQVSKGYAYVTRTWNQGDEIHLEIPMEIERMVAHPNVKANAGKIALQRGPVVYCLEQVDNGENLASIEINGDSLIEERFEEELLNGVMVLSGKAKRTEVTSDVGQALYMRTEDVNTSETTFTAIPYYAWANRGEGEMTVWVRSGK